VIPQRFRPRAPRNAEFVSLLESFLIAAVTTVLIIRTQLWLTNYPQLGGGGLHIAHLLYGGIFMAIAIGILLMYLGRGPRRPAALVGGVGFGFFIDELGKFVTEDNNYFFRPAAGVIYLVFIAIFLSIRSLASGRALTDEERAANAIYLEIDASHGRLHERERQQAVALLAGADHEDPLLTSLRTMISELRGLPSPPPRFYERWADAATRLYLRATRWRAFRPVLTGVIVIYALSGFLTVLMTVIAVGFELGGDAIGIVSEDDLNYLHVAASCCYAVSTLFIVIGLVRLRRDRLAAYHWFERALLVSILLTRVFLFVESQFGAAVGAALDILLLLAVRSMIHAEQGDPEETVSLLHPPGQEPPLLATSPRAAPGTPRR
jgi:hypothetical protein